MTLEERFPSLIQATHSFSEAEKQIITERSAFELSDLIKYSNKNNMKIQLLTVIFRDQTW